MSNTLFRLCLVREKKWIVMFWSQIKISKTFQELNILPFCFWGFDVALYWCFPNFYALRIPLDNKYIVSSLSIPALVLGQHSQMSRLRQLMRQVLIYLNTLSLGVITLNRICLKHTFRGKCKGWNYWALFLPNTVLICWRHQNGRSIFPSQNVLRSFNPFLGYAN